jgi:hypothetical protein
MALAVAAQLLASAVALGAEPTPGGGGAGDPRSPGQGPGLVGDPGFAIAVLVFVAVASVVATLIYLRLSSPADRTGRDR